MAMSETLEPFQTVMVVILELVELLGIQTFAQVKQFEIAPLKEQ